MYLDISISGGYLNDASKNVGNQTVQMLRGVKAKMDE